jgi:glycosyltransferase involved in cell wall biosynthesis
MRPSSLSNGYSSKIFYWLIENCEIILLSKLLESDFDRNKLSASKVHIISNGIKAINPGTFKLSEMVQSRIKGTQIVLYIGHLLVSKGYRRVLDIAYLFKDRVNVEFHFAGEYGSLEEQIYFNDFVSRNHLTNVKYLGVLRGKKKSQAFINSSMLILPSYSEALPLTLLEAMSVGLPIIATPVGAIPEVLSKTISKVSKTDEEFSDSIDYIINKYDYSHANEIVTKYTSTYSEEVFEELFNKLL